MSGNSTPKRKAQLDKAEREHLEDIVAEMRERVEDNVRFQLTQADLDTRPSDDETVDEETEQLIEAIELEAVDDTNWDEAFEEYVDGVGYTIVNRLAALRCMEVRDFIDEEVTVFKENGLTPAAETLVHEEFLLEDEAILAAYHNTCDELAEEIEILFDRSSAYSLIDPDDDTFEELCETLDKISDEVWQADDVLGWVYEYYNVTQLSAVRDRARESQLSVEDVSVANQFYTPHWVVRMLTDNSLGKRYLESKEKLTDSIDIQRDLTAEERTNRLVRDTETVSEICTYLFADDDISQTTDAEMDNPTDIRVLDPACGSGHFLLYAFDVLERIWWQERPDVEKYKVPSKILKHNLYGVDIDRRATQLAAFNLYLKAREKSEHWGANSFNLDTVGIVCADSRIADMDAVDDVIDEVASEQPAIREPLQQIVNAFEDIHGLGSLLDVKGTISEEMLQDQTTLTDSWDGIRSLSVLIDRLRDAISDHQKDTNLLAQDLHSFLQLLQILTQDYDVTLMNPPYGSQRRMPDSVKSYVKDHYKYYPEYYINFFELCDSVIKSDGRIGMLVPRSFMFRRTFKEFREDFVGELGSFDFLTEFGKGILDNATVRTVGTVVRSNNSNRQSGTFIRLYDVDKAKKENVFSESLNKDGKKDVRRIFQVPLQDFSNIPWTPISYTLPQSARDLHESTQKIDPTASKIEGNGVANIAQGLGTGDNDRFVRQFWEVPNEKCFKPYAKGGAEAWVMPNVDKMVNYRDNGREMRPLAGSRVQNSRYYGQEGLTWTYIKATGRRFGYLPAGSIFDQRGPMCFPKSISPWLLMSVLNSTLYHGLFLSLTPEREWTIGDLGRIPWQNELTGVSQLDEFAREQYQIVKQLRSHEINSPYYIGSPLIPDDKRTGFFYNHPYVNSGDSSVEDDVKSDYNISADQSIESSVQEIENQKHKQEQRLERISSHIDDIIYQKLDIGEYDQKEIETEIAFRTGTKPAVNEKNQPESFSITDQLVYEAVEDLIHHCVLVEVREDTDGIIPINKINDKSSIFERVIDRLEKFFGDHTEDRLSEIDNILGAKSADQEAYPNIKHWLTEDLFDYHVKNMKNTPILWRLSSERLVSNPNKEGFACYIDYHDFNSGTLDRLQSQYIEPRKVELREQKSAADRRRSEDSLSTNERSKAAEKYKQVVSSLEQINQFEQTLQELAKTKPRGSAKSISKNAKELQTKVSTFRKETTRLLDAVTHLQKLKDEEWFEERFSPTFLETVEENRKEWIEVLEDLETACEAYSQNASTPVEAHYYDLFTHFSDLIGSDHYASNGILFMTYYFEREGTEFLNNQNEPKDDLIDEETQILANLASNLEDYKEMSEDIKNGCKNLQQDISSKWENRALSEITTSGYQPNQKHGVKINIAPLVEAEIVPKIVDEKVI